jgi:predicted SpoU family rRNA methylase
MYTILHNETDKVTNLNSDKELMEFVEKIVKENGDEGNFSIIGVSDAKEYIEDFCPNLTLEDEYG